MFGWNDALRRGGQAAAVMPTLLPFATGAALAALAQTLKASPVAVGVPSFLDGYLADGEPVDAGRPVQGQIIEQP